MIDFSQVTEMMLGSSMVEQITNSMGDILWSKSGDDPANSYFYVEDVSGSDNTLSIGKLNSGAPTIEVFKSTDTVNWTSMGTTDTNITAIILANSKLYLKATESVWAYNYSDSNYITASGTHNIGGNIMSLLNGDNFENTSFGNVERQFARLFSASNTLNSASNLVLPNNVTASCYDGMFYNCSGLTAAPVLPATTLASNCYISMFMECPLLTTAPVLPATVLVDDCYHDMFTSCTSLNSVTTYAQDISASNCLYHWLNNVSATGDFYNIGGATYERSESGIPEGWTEHRANCNVSISAGSNGTVSVNGVSGNYSQSVPSDTQLTLVATPDNGYIFGSWSDGDTNATRTITVTNDLTLTAAFDVYTGVPDYHIQYTTTDNNQLSLSDSVITNHTFTNGVGDITINTTTLPARFFENKTTLRTLAYGGNIDFADGGYQHSGCTNLESVELPTNMTYIPQRWFRSCRKLSRLDLPVSAMTWNISWPFYYTATQTTEGVLHVYVHNSTTLPTMDYTKYADPHDNDFYVTGNIGGSNPSHSTDIKNLIRLHVPSSLYNDYITTAPHSVVASCISSY